MVKKKALQTSEAKEDNGPVLEDTLFKLAIAFAKAIAKKNSIESLRPDVVLSGFQLALADKNISVRYPKILAKLDAISASVKACGLTIPDHIKMIEAEKFPSSTELKTILAAKEISLEELIDQLISVNLATPSIEGSEYTEILMYASFLAKKMFQNEITPEVFSCAAYIAFLHGRFSKNQALSTHFLANHLSYEALLSQLGIEQEWQPQGTIDLVKICGELLETLKIEGSDEERLFSCLDLGLRKGRNILDTIATAYHEAGHAVVSAVLRPAISISKVSIVPDEKEGYQGVTWFKMNPSEDIQTSADYLSEICVDLAGRAAQLIKFGPTKIDFGATGDLQMATKTAWEFVAERGLDPEFGMISLKTLANLQGEPIGWLFDKAHQRLHAIINQEAKRAEGILRENWDKVESITQDLLTKKVIAETSISNDMISTGLAGVKGVQSAKSIPVDHPFVIASRPGIIRTPEGPVRYETGDALTNIESGLNWVVGKRYFEKYYEPSGRHKFGTDGIYRKKLQTVMVLELQENKRIDFKDGRGILFGVKGDWLVDYGEGEMSIIQRGQFFSLYTLAPDAKNS